MDLRDFSWSEAMAIVIYIQEHNDSSAKINILFIYMMLHTQAAEGEE